MCSHCFRDELQLKCHFFSSSSFPFSAELDEWWLVDYVGVAIELKSGLPLQI